jgi:hypothetical protein
MAVEFPGLWRPTRRRYPPWSFCRVVMSPVSFGGGIRPGTPEWTVAISANGTAQRSTPAAPLIC